MYAKMIQIFRKLSFFSYVLSQNETPVYRYVNLVKKHSKSSENFHKKRELFICQNYSDCTKQRCLAELCLFKNSNKTEYGCENLVK